jgi:hypothetical protein
MSMAQISGAVPENPNPPTTENGRLLTAARFNRHRVLRRPAALLSLVLLAAGGGENLYGTTQYGNANSSCLAAGTSG